MNIFSKADNFIVAPFQSFVSFLESKGKNASSWLVVMTITSFILFLIAEALQTYVNFRMGYSNVGYTDYVGIKSLEIKALHWNLMPFLLTIILSFAIRDYNNGNKSKWNSFFFDFAASGEFIGLQGRVLYVYIFILTLYDIGEMESVKTIWHLFYRSFNDYHYFLGVASGLSVIFCILSFFMVTLSMFFVGCKYSDK